ncbi:MAG: homoserine O-acetyltransferase [Chloroflexota bacterium]|nr:homoserine O-acetyltransferase [Chloroflexota bacterium]MEC9451479.1 homoserine O-acetyltransferase [Chloroflexota bacterium]MQG04153.1 homoserine O-acetyltransferase [SAR202 cluster bacterium]
MVKENYNSDLYRTGDTSKYLKNFLYEGKFQLQSGDILDKLNIAYETYGDLNEDRSNVVLVCHAISGDSHVAKHNEDDIPGWWDIMVGPDKPIDTNNYFVICSNVIGGCKGSTGPNSINPETGNQYGPDFPNITVEDMVNAQNLLIDHLGIKSILCVTGGSMGGFQSIQWARQFPNKIKSVIGLATSARLTNQALAFDIVGRNAIKKDPRFKEGNYYDAEEKPEDGLAIARMLAHITYVSKDSMKNKFENTRYEPREITTEFEKRFSVGTYLAYQGTKFVDRFDANSYITLSTAVDYFDLGGTINEIKNNLKKTTCEWLLVSFSSDWLYPPFQSEEIVDALVSLDKSVSYCSIESEAGHDAFLLENEVEDYGLLTSSFLKKLSGKEKNDQIKNASPTSTNIFFNDRLDLDFICSLIEKNDRVLDLGCEDGKLLNELKKKKCSKLLGIELDSKKVIMSSNKGLEVINSDINTGLNRFNDDQFDVTILSQTLQSIKNVEKTIEEILRISKKAIISFPNFAFKPLREMLYKEGKAPKLEGLYGYNWYNTPNRRFPTILDFQEYCASKKIIIKESFYIDSEKDELIKEEPNLNADTAIFVLSKN